MEVKLRDPRNLMKLSKLGSFHQSKLSFLRSFLNEFKDWNYNRDLFQLNEKGYGIAVYSFSKNKRVYSLVCFANQIKDEERSDRVIATKWTEFHLKKILIDWLKMFQNKKLEDYHTKS